MSFFGVPLSGLIASQDQLQTVSNNLANVSTDGYKDQNVTFNDLFSQASVFNGAGDPVQTGFGVTTASTTSDFSDGSTSATGISSNMALSGTGFFEVQQSTGSVAYTRSGDFTTNNAGDIVDSSGDQVLGYGAVNGVVNTGSIGSINVGSGVTALASASTAFSLTSNLNSGAAVGATLTSNVPVYDTLGTQHVLGVTFTNTGAGAWNYAVTIPTADVTSGGTGTTTLATGSVAFNSSGALTTTPTTVTVQTPVAPAVLADGAAPLSLTFSLAGLTGTSAASSTNATTSNGTAGGTLTGYSIETNGAVEGTFSGGGTQILGQVAVATFENQQGLSQIGNTDYISTNASGPASVGIAGIGGRGTITGGSVEASNVDVAAEFAKMIVAQQAYSGDAKVVTTFDQISQATIAMVSA